jgi:hypothetical protein
MRVPHPEAVGDPHATEAATFVMVPSRSFKVCGSCRDFIGTCDFCAQPFLPNQAVTTSTDLAAVRAIRRPSRGNKYYEDIEEVCGDLANPDLVSWYHANCKVACGSCGCVLDVNRHCPPKSELVFDPLRHGDEHVYRLCEDCPFPSAD